MDQLSALCRVCLATSKLLESLDTQYDQGYSLRFMLTNFCSLQMDDISAMYNNICKDCSTEIQRSYNFKVQCEQSDALLRQKAQALKYESICSKETKYSGGEVEICVVKKEVDHTQYYYDESEGGGKKEEGTEWGAGGTQDDNYRSDGENSSHSVDNKSSLLSLKTESKPTVDTSNEEGVRRTRSGTKKKPIQHKQIAKLVDTSFQKLGYMRVYECPKCGNFFKTFTLIYRHLKKIHCLILKRTENYDELWAKERKAKGLPEKAPKEDIDDVKMFDSDKLVYKCVDCPHRNADYEVIKKHIIDQHREAKFIHCPEEDCQYSTNEPRNLNNHINLMHKNQRGYSCELCDYHTGSKYSMNLHHTTKHLNIKPFECQHCSKVFSANQGLKFHIAMKHDKDLLFFCPTCTKGFYTKRHLKVHMKIHLGLKPHICEHCGKAFTQKANLEKHVFTSHTSSQEDNVLCAQCSFKAKNIYSLNKHMMIHKERPRFYCDYCGKDFATKDMVKRHIWRHIGWEPYKCPTCTYTCDTNCRLQAHMMKHTGERPFRCHLCEYGTVTQKKLNAHVESHLNEHKYKCELCPYTANRRDSLKRHLRTKCGTLTRKYIQTKTRVSREFTQFNMNHLMPENCGPSTSVAMDITHIKYAN